MRFHCKLSPSLFHNYLTRFSRLSYFFRAVGLESLNALVRIWWGNQWDAPEPAKAARQKSLWIALSRCAIHVLPLANFSWLLWINYHAYYMGPGLSVNGKSDNAFLASYQVAAKTQEVLCVASLTTIVLDLLRYELLNGEGVPIGLLGSGISFSSISYFWSPEFFSAARYCFTSWKRCRLYVFLILAGLLAVVIGPASAVLLLPRIQTIEAGNTQYYLNGTAGQFWPSVITLSSEYAACTLPNATQYARNFNYSNQVDADGYNRYASSACFSHYNPKLEAAGGVTACEYSFLNQSPLAMLPAMITTGRFSGAYAETFALQPHGATTAVLQNLDAYWFNAVYSYPTARTISQSSSLSEYKYTSHFVSSTTTTIPLVRVRCLNFGMNITRGADEVNFPYMHNTVNGLEWADDYKNASIASLNRNPSIHLRTQWLPLPAETFGPVSTGLLFELPWTSSLDLRVAFGCTVSAIWAEGTLTSDSVSSQYAWSSKLLTDYTSQGGWKLRIYLNAKSSTTNWANQLITLDSSWLSALTPPAPDTGFQDGSWVPNTIEQIISDTRMADVFNDYRTRAEEDFLNGQCKWAYADQNYTQVDMWNDRTCNKGNKEILIESTIAAVIADGLSRFGSSRIFNTAPDLQDWTLQRLRVDNNALLRGKQAVQLPSDPNLVIQTMHVTIDGYAYNASSITDYLSTAVACIYMLIVSLHTIWILWHRVTSSSWDTVTDLISLCQNSPSTHMLDNTSAGIQRLATYTKIVKIRAVRLGNDTDEQRLSLLFSGDDSSSKSTSSQTAITVLAKSVLFLPPLSMPQTSSMCPTPTTARSQASDQSQLAYTFVETDKKYN